MEISPGIHSWGHRIPHIARYVGAPGRGMHLHLLHEPASRGQAHPHSKLCGLSRYKVVSEPDVLDDGLVGGVVAVVVE
jgi:hypothetical protein